MTTETRKKENWVRKSDGSMELTGERVEEITCDENGVEISRVLVSEWGVL